MNKYFACCVFAILAILSGCGKNIPISGTVTFSDDGSPLTVGTVIFTNGTQNATGHLDANGHYRLGFEKAGNGIPKGDYSVYISGANTVVGTLQSTDESDDAKRADYVSVIDKKFASAQKSGLRFSVDGSTKTFDFQVDRAPKP